MDALIEYADRLVSAGLERIPDGAYVAEDAIEDDGFGSGRVPIRATLTVEGPTLTIDFEGTSPQVPGGVNAVAAITASATRYVVRCVVEALLGEPLPAGGGSMSSVELVLPGGERRECRAAGLRPRPATSRRASGSRTCSCSPSPRRCPT